MDVYDFNRKKVNCISLWLSASAIIIGSLQTSFFLMDFLMVGVPNH